MGRRVLSLKGQGLSRLSRERRIWSEKSWDCQDGLGVVVFGLKLVRTFGHGRVRTQKGRAGQHRSDWYL